MSFQFSYTCMKLAECYYLQASFVRRVWLESRIVVIPAL